MELNATQKILTLKVVYYGPALGGKTTNLLTIHALTDKEKRNELISIATRDDRTLFFDLLPLGLGKFFGFELKLKLFTVPGQVQFDVTRRRVLAGADAVVFVADSQKAQAAANALSLKNLRINMNQNKLDPKTTALAVQFNKRDLPDLLSVEEMNRALNDDIKAPSFPAVATSGAGVIECLASAVSRAVEGIASGRGLASPADARRAATGIQNALMVHAIKGPGQVAAEGAASAGATGGGTRSPASAPQAAARSGAALSSPTGASGQGRATGTPSPGNAGAQQSPANAYGTDPAGTWTHKADVKVTDEVDLLDEAVKANLALSDRLASFRLGSERVGRREQQVRTLGLLARLAEESSDPTKIEMELLTLALQAMGLGRGSLLSKPPSGPLAVRYLAGHGADPLASIASPPLGSLAERMIAAGRVHLSNDIQSEILFGETHSAASGIHSLLFSPLRLGDGSFGGLFLYGGDGNDTLDASDELFIEASCRITSLARLRVHAAAAVR